MTDATHSPKRLSLLQLVGFMLLAGSFSIAGCATEAPDQQALDRVESETPLQVDLTDRLIFKVPLDDIQSGVWKAEAGAPEPGDESDGTSIIVTIGDDVVFEGSGVRETDAVRFEVPLPLLRSEVRATVDGVVVVDGHFGPIAVEGKVAIDGFLEVAPDDPTEVIKLDATPRLGRDLGWIAIQPGGEGTMAQLPIVDDESASHGVPVRFEVVDDNNAALLAVEATVYCIELFNPLSCSAGFGLVVPDGSAAIVASINGTTIGEFRAGAEPPELVSLDLVGEGEISALEWSATDDGTTEMRFEVKELDGDGDWVRGTFWESGNGLLQPAPLDDMHGGIYQLLITDGLNITVVPLTE